MSTCGVCLSRRVSAGGVCLGDVCLGGVSTQGVYTPPCEQNDILGGGCLPGGVCPGGGVHPLLHDGIHPPVNRMTHRCKNITLPQTSFAGGKKKILPANL